MPTHIYQNDLVLFAEASSQAGADNSAVSEFTDLSGNGRHLTASSAQPVLKTSAVTGKSASGDVETKKSIVFDGTRNPLSYSGSVRFKSAFIVCKLNEFTQTDGLLSSLANVGILVGVTGTNLWYDLRHEHYEYRLNDRIYSPKRTWQNGETVSLHTPPAPVGGWGIIYLHFWRGITLDGIQLGRDRTWVDRNLNGEVALLALYDHDFCEGDLRKQMRSIAYSYQIPLAESFPFQGSKGDPYVLNPYYLSDGQRNPTVRIKGSPLKGFTANFGTRNQTELRTAEAFYLANPPPKTFLYRQYEMVPPVDTPVRYPVDYKPEFAPNLQQSAYAQEFIESERAVSYSIPLTQPAISTEAIVPTEPTAPNFVFFEAEPVAFGSEEVIFS